MRLACIIALAAAAVAGCAEPGPSATTVAAVDMQSLPSAINIDGRDGPDAVQVIVYLYHPSKPAPMVAQGPLEFLLYDGRLTQDAMAKATPLQTWRFGPSELPRYRARGMPGYGYAFQLAWTQGQPRSANVTVVARYTEPGGRTVQSAPTVVGLTAQ
jgi:hypothetical protein